MRVAVSIPDDVHAEAEAYTRKVDLRRSDLYVAALREYLAKHRDDAVTEALNRVYDSTDAERDAVVDAVAARTLERVEW